MRDIELGELACAIVDLEVWRAFGYASFDHYCRERIGLAASSVATRVALTRRFGNVPGPHGPGPGSHLLRGRRTGCPHLRPHERACLDRARDPTHGEATYAITGAVLPRFVAAEM